MKTLKVVSEQNCNGCLSCVLACSRKLGKGLSIESSFIKVQEIGPDNFKVLIDLGQMTPELAKYIAPYCPRQVLEVADSD